MIELIEKIISLLNYRIIIIFSVIFFLFNFLLILLPLPEEFSTFSGIMSNVGGSLYSTIMFFLATYVVQKNKPLRYSLFSLSLGLFFNLAADSIFYFRELQMKGSAFPSVSDIIYIFSYISFFIGLMIYPAGKRNLHRKFVVLLEISTVLISSILLFTEFIIGPVIPQESTFEEKVLSIFYPTADFILFWITLHLLFSNIAKEEVATVSFLGLGFFSFIFADVLFSYYEEKGIYYVGHFSEIIYLFFHIFCGLSSVSIIQSYQKKMNLSQFKNENIKWLTYIPYLFLSFSLIILYYSYYHKTFLSFEIVFFAIMMILILINIRQLVFIYDFRVLNRELKESEERFKVLVESTSNGIVIHNRGIIIECNEGLAKMMGYSREELIGMNGLLLFSEKSRNDVINKINTGYDLPYEAIALRKNGEEFPVRIQAKNVYYKGKLVRAVDAMDLTDLKQKEKEILDSKAKIEESEKQFRLIYENSPLGIFIAKPDGSIQSINQSLLKMLGSPSEETTKLINILSFEPLIQAGYSEKFQECVKTGNIIFTQMYYTSKWGKSGFFTSYLIPLKNSKGEVEKVYTLIEDVTERKKMEEELRIAKERAEESDRMKSTFLANISHEIRTPLNGIIGMAQLLENTSLNEEQQFYLKNISVSGELLLSIINDILDLSKIEAGKLELDSISFDLEKLIEDLVMLFSIKAYSKGLEIIYNIEQDVPISLIGDPLRLKQILLNLISNAIKFSEKGEIFINVSLDSETENEVMIQFSVKDKGIGIPEDKKNQIFQKFVQLDFSLTRKEGGTGLGLVISRELVSLMGGKMDFESQYGQGSNFWFTAKFKKDSKYKQQKNESLKDLRILIIDDNLIFCKVLSNYITRWGAIAEIALDSESALTKLHTSFLQNQHFHLIFINEKMREIIKKTNSKFEIQSSIILMVSLNNKIEESLLQETGYNHYITKPILFSKLLKEINKILHPEKEKIYDTEKIPEFIQKIPFKKKYKILIVEDNEINQKVIQGMLKKLGLQELDIANNGKEAIEKLAFHNYDLIFMDVQMPEMDGYEATRQIRNHPKHFGIPIIAMTAYAMSGDREKCLEAGMNDYIAKPVTLDSLIKILNQWLFLDRENQIHFQPDNFTNIQIRSSKEIWDYENVLNRLLGDKDLVKTIMDEYIQDLPQEIKILDESIRNKDVQKIVFLAHKIKGASANIGAEKIRKICYEIELAGKNNQIEKIPELFQEFLNAYQELKIYFQNQHEG